MVEVEGEETSNEREKGEIRIVENEEEELR